MAMFIFVESMLAGRPIKVFNHGRMRRDFTYVDDIVEGVCRTLDQVPAPDPPGRASSPIPAPAWPPTGSTISVTTIPWS